MSELESLPDLDVHFDEVPVLEVKTKEVKEEVHDIPDMDLPSQPTEQPVSNIPKMILIKKQVKPLPWHAPEQDFHISRHEIDPSDLGSLDKFVEAHIPQDPSVKLAALKFIEDVLLEKIQEHESKIFYNDGKNKSFRISFVF